MNTRCQFKSLFRFAGLLALLAAALPARAQLTPTVLTNLSGVPALITTASASNINTAFNVPQGKSLQIAVNFAANNSTTDPVIVWWKPSVDGTNYLTTPIGAFSVAANGTTQVVGGTNLAAGVLEGYRKIMFTTISNASARTFYLTNLSIGWKN